MSRAIVTATISAQNTFTDWIVVGHPFNISVSGTFSATITLQRSFDEGSTVLDVEQYTEATEKQGEEIEDGISYRLGIKTGDYTSGSAVMRLSY